MMFALAFLGSFALALSSYHFGRVVERKVRAAFAPAADETPEKQPTYREAGKVEKARRVEVGIAPPTGGAFVITEGPDLFKTSCGRCGSRFAYRLEDTKISSAGIARVDCPRCRHPEIHIA